MVRHWVLLLVCLAGTGHYVVRADSQETDEGAAREKRASNAEVGVAGTKIIGGSTPPPKKFPWMALLQRSGSFVCGGSLITRRHVLTAKHCVGNYAANKFKVILGEYRRSSSDGTEQTRYVSSIIKHPSVDAAILVLSSYATLNTAVKTVRLARYTPGVGTQMTASGWGWTMSGTSSSSNYLQYITLPRASTTACNAEGLNMKSHEICIGKSTGSYINVCHGDSGSPLVYPAYPNTNPLQVGIVERGHGGCPSKYKYAVFVSVPAIYSWIIDNVGCHMPGTWTGWLDRDDPSGVGDYENRSLQKPLPCGGKEPICHSYKIVSTSYCSSPHSDCKGSKYQKITHSRTYGLSCVNSAQGTVTKGWWFAKKKYKCRCCDYAVRFKCPL